MEINEIHEKIIGILKNRGPSLPIQISKQIGLSSLFVSAFLSELTDEKRIKVSHLKVGGSPLYYLQGQEEQLEKFYKYLHPKEAEAFILIKKNRILKDSEQEPAIRIALRNIKDFAVGFKKGDEIYWKYSLAPESEIIEILTPKIPQTSQIPQISTQLAIKKMSLIKVKPKLIQKLIEKPEFENPLAIKQEKPKKEKPKSGFVLKTLDYFNKNNYKILEGKNYKSEEYNCILQIHSDLGPTNFLTRAKNKKTISEADLKKLLSQAQSIPLPALFLHTGELSKKAKEYAEKYFSILKIKKL